jgi:protein involved in polysaccharide export with SLBB domain
MKTRNSSVHGRRTLEIRVARIIASSLCAAGILVGVDGLADQSSAAPPVAVSQSAETIDPPVVSGSLSVEPGGAGGNQPAWQEHLTLGPGDVLNLSLFGEPDLSKVEVFVGPDGRISYLEAAGVLASGLTIDELRAKCDEELGKYRRAPRTIITPVAFHSKKYFVLGKVSQTGVYTLDHPMTIVEAVARARGLETGMADRNVVEVADLSRSFLVRQGKRFSINFEKLFSQGDLSQNLPLEPDDYLYFAANDLQEAYVLGEVNHPGSVAINSHTSVIRSIAERGGFTAHAWNRKVLVIRGSLSKPQTFAVDAGAMLSAGTPDFQLQPKDIVYVSARPWIKAEELLDAAATAFVESVVVTWTGGSITLIH